MRFSIQSAMILGAVFVATTAAADNINVVGSSTVYPFSTVVSELFAQNGGGKAPKIEATGTGGGLKIFCSGGKNAPDMANASRAIKKSEEELCAKNGVIPMEIKIGYDGIVIAHAVESAEIALSQQQLFLALAKNTPAENGEMRDNPHKTWQNLDPSLPDVAIRVYGPPPTSGTRDAFAELALEKGCDTYPQLAAIKNKLQHRAICHGVREDGAYIESGENDNLIIQKLVATPTAVGIFGFSFLEENIDKVRGIAVNGVSPSFEAIADGSYPLSRPLFFYVNRARFESVPRIKAFVEFFVSEEVMGEDGVLVDRGLIPLSAEEYAGVRAVVAK